MNSFIYNGKEIKYTLKRSKRKTIGITVTEEAHVIISTPANLKSIYIDEILEKRAEWILKKLELMKERQLEKICRRFENGEKFYLLGKEYTLRILNCFKNCDDGKCFLDKDILVIDFFDKQLKESKYNSENVYIEGGNLYVIIVNNLDDNKTRRKYMKEVIKEFYFKKALNFFKERMEFFSKNMEIYPNRITVKEVKTLWGSCSSKRNITLNWKLIMAPPYIIDYVIVHELCHIRHMDHSRDFWMEVAKVIPDYQYRRKWLKENGHLCQL
ncbi:M48 family metallopeptidase [Haloimpatiens massiliensis]|uniref:M48 family metallopeptidase n=1 Tax=Haloimpatiens massiliensis TaxID=1658110 RepID=UPI000C846092|nr:SprT family zinc-dependent metalloprotease [Haloimpatiens massiliensis]